MSKTANLNLRIEQGQKSKLEELAKKDKRSLNSLCEIAFDYFISFKKKSRSN